MHSDFKFKLLDPTLSLVQHVLGKAHVVSRWYVVCLIYGFVFLGITLLSQRDPIFLVATHLLRYITYDLEVSVTVCCQKGQKTLKLNVFLNTRRRGRFAALLLMAFCPPPHDLLCHL